MKWGFVPGMNPWTVRPWRYDHGKAHRCPPRSRNIQTPRAPLPGHGHPLGLGDHGLRDTGPGTMAARRHRLAGAMAAAPGGAGLVFWILGRAQTGRGALLARVDAF